MQPIPALQNPREANRPKILSFDKAIEGLKAAKHGSVQCAAFSSYGRCHKFIDFKYPGLLSLLEQLSTTDKSSIAHLIHSMLCPTHWPQTLYYCAMFLDFISDFEFYENTKDYEDIIIDLESAKIITVEGCSTLKSSVVSNDITKGQEGQCSATSSSKEGADSNSFQIPASHTNTAQLSRVTSTTSTAQTSTSTAKPENETNNETHCRTCDAFPKDEQARKILKGFPFVRSQPYVLVELGVARLEITYQTGLKCISMAPNGWRCKELIQTEQLLEARRILCSLSGSTNEFKNLSKLLLCPDHSLGDLPQLYSEAWSAFSANRLPKKEALSKFEIERRTLKPQQRILEEDRRKQPEISQFTTGYTPKSTIEVAKPIILVSLQSKNLTETPPATTSSLLTIPASSALTSLSSQISTPVINRVGTPNDPDNTANYRNTDSVTKLGTTESTIDRSPLRSLERGIKIPFPSPHAPNRNITVKFPPSSSNVSNEISKFSSEFSRTKISNEASSWGYSSSITNAGTQDTAVSKDNMGNRIPQPSQSLAPPTFQRGPKQPMQMFNQGVVHDSIIYKMLSSISRGGYVYILKSARQNLVKIGKATDVALRIEEIKAECRRLDDVVEVNSDSHRVNEPERVLGLVLSELQNFQIRVNCSPLRSDAGEEVRHDHREWFRVPEEVAVQSVQRWREFVERAYTPEGTIREDWARKASLLPRPGSLELENLKTGLGERSESHLKEYHRLRHERYRKWMEDSNG